ncbi:MAG: hypothetical protein PHY47_18320 [Lachnospiraceae bacterium]|nr:hypothetical protein [Lachnospiraceae bacterium]
MVKVMPMTRNMFYEQLQREIKSTDNVFGNFLVNAGLYEKIEITEDNVFELADLVGGHVKIDIYCPECGENRVFSCESIPYFWYDDYNNAIKGHTLEQEIVVCQQYQMTRESSSPDETEEPWVWTNKSLEDDVRLMVFRFFCAMDHTHHLDYIVLTYGNTMKKIGQYPSVADLSFPELKEYRHVMAKEDEKELRRAIGLFADGIGVGSFVYLRRIFERIIVTASQKAIKEGKIKEEEFSKARVNEKIKMLEEYLPKSLANNSGFYGIVSKGIHQLSEEECLDYFPVMKSFIIMILRQWEKIWKDEEEEKKIKASLGNIASKVK